MRLLILFKAFLIVLFNVFCHTLNEVCGEKAGDCSHCDGERLLVAIVVDVDISAPSDVAFSLDKESNEFFKKFLLLLLLLSLL
jgi:hypothetical protein